MNQKEFNSLAAMSCTQRKEETEKNLEKLADGELARQYESAGTPSGKAEEMARNTRINLVPESITNKDANTAVADISGEMILRAEFMGKRISTTYPLDQQVRMLVEDGPWKICGVRQENGR